MEIFNLHRGQGKTTFLIMYSCLTKKPIIVAHERQKKCLSLQAKRMGFNIPEPITIHNLLCHKGLKNKDYLIDELGMVLTELFKELNINIDIATITANNTEREDIERLYKKYYAEKEM